MHELPGAPSSFDGARLALRALGEAEDDRSTSCDTVYVHVSRHGCRLDSGALVFPAGGAGWRWGVAWPWDVEKGSMTMCDCEHGETLRR